MGVVFNPVHSEECVLLPETMPPSAHHHPITDIDSATFPPNLHHHPLTDIDAIQFPPTAHQHSIVDITQRLLILYTNYYAAPFTEQYETLQFFISELGSDSTMNSFNYIDYYYNTPQNTVIKITNNSSKEAIINIRMNNNFTALLFDAGNVLIPDFHQTVQFNLARYETIEFQYVGTELIKIGGNTGSAINKLIYTNYDLILPFFDDNTGFMNKRIFLTQHTYVNVTSMSNKDYFEIMMSGDYRATITIRHPYTVSLFGVNYKHTFQHYFTISGDGAIFRIDARVGTSDTRVCALTEYTPNIYTGTADFSTGSSVVSESNILCYLHDYMQFRFIFKPTTDNTQEDINNAGLTGYAYVVNNNNSISGFLNWEIRTSPACMLSGLVDFEIQEIWP